MAVISMKQLLEAGVHFGHQTRRWNPKMRKYIYAARNDIHIIDLQITVQLIEQAYKFVAETVQQGKSVLFVGTKKQAQEAIQQEADRCGQFYINSRWLGGTLTNFKTIRSRIDRLNKLMMMEKMGEFELLPKKEVLGLKKEMDKLNANLGGIREMRTAPGVMFVVDPDFEKIAVTEAIKLNIPIVAITDTNCDPDLIDYVIPGNDDAIRAVKLIASVIADAVIEANQGEAYVNVTDETAMETASAEIEIATISKEEILAAEEAELLKAAAAKKAKKEEKAAEPAAIDEVEIAPVAFEEEKAAPVAEVAPVKKAKAKKEEVAATLDADKVAEAEVAPAKKARAKKEEAPAALDADKVAEAEVAPAKKTRAKKETEAAPAAEAPVKKTRAKKAETAEKSE